MLTTEEKEYIAGCKNTIIYDSFVKADSVINNPDFENIYCSISGGADSDLVLDIIHRVDKDKKSKYVWFNTGLELQATKDHLTYLENKYDIEIERIKAVKSVPASVKEYGVPFLSKMISERIDRAQKKGFDFTDKEYSNLLTEYKGSKCWIDWWCNIYSANTTSGFTHSNFNIDYKPYLKEFMLQNPPDFKISSECCNYAKKKTAHKFEKDNNIQLAINGLRKAEGGIRSFALKSCFTNKKNAVSQYRPLFWYSDNDKSIYETYFNIVHSRCYTEYGMKRTGCVGCPFSQQLDEDLEVIKQFEPNLYKATINVFGKSYEYTKMYKEFRKTMKSKSKNKQLKLFDINK